MRALNQLRSLEAVPGVQFFTGNPGTSTIPGDAMDVDGGKLASEMVDPDTRLTRELEGRKDHAADMPEGAEKNADAMKKMIEEWKSAPRVDIDEEEVGDAL